MLGSKFCFFPQYLGQGSARIINTDVDPRLMAIQLNSTKPPVMSKALEQKYTREAPLDWFIKKSAIKSLADKLAAGHCALLDVSYQLSSLFE